MKDATKAKRYQQVMEAIGRERERVNKSINSGSEATIDTYLGRYQLDFVDPGFWYYSHPIGQTKTWTNERRWAGCNDGQWADIMGQLRLEREPIFNKAYQTVKGWQISQYQTEKAINI